MSAGVDRFAPLPTAPEVNASPLKPKRCRITSRPSVKALASPSSSMSKEKQPGQDEALSGSVPAVTSSASVNPSLSSSRSALLPMPSPSVSTVSALLVGKASALSPTLSPSVSDDSAGLLGKASLLSPTPSPSVSSVSVASFGKASALSPTPSLSESAVSDESFGKASCSSTTPSLSKSAACSTKLILRIADCVLRSASSTL